MRQNVHLNTTFYQRETSCKPNLKVSEAQAIIELVVGLVILGLLTTLCLVVGWAA